MPTFNSIGVSIGVRGAFDGLDPELTYRTVGAANWDPALTPVACPSEHVFRGSVLLLQPGTAYEIKARIRRAGRSLVDLRKTVRTWPDRVRVARVITLPSGVRSEPLVIRDHGTAEGWIVYRGAPAGTVIDVGTSAPHAIVLDHAAYVLVDGLVVRGGTSDAVCVTDSHDVRVRGCDISGWGDPGRWGFYDGKKHKQWAYLDAAGRMIDHQEGVRVQGAGSTRVVVEENLIHHPRGTANCWAFQHPHGPEGIVLSETGGNNVVRNNDIIVGDGHRWNDAIASEYNSHVTGGPYRDTDICSNLLVGANDDGTELDGGQINVRYWGNWIEGGLCGVSCAPNLRGPSYVFRNLVESDGDERGACGAGFKMGGTTGTTFLLNNTVYVGNFGLTSGHYGKVSSAIVSRNNVFAGPAAGLGKLRCDWSVMGDLDHDLVPPGGLVGTLDPGITFERAGLFALPSFVAPDTGDFRLREDSPGRYAGIAVPNLVAAGSDLGAIQDRGWADWPLRRDTPDIRPARPVVWLRQGTVAEVRLDVTKVASGLRWQARAGETWTTCRVPRGRFTGPGTLVVRVDATTLAPGPHRTFVSVRTAEGRLRSVPLLVEVTPAHPVVRRFEAERLSPGPGFETVSASNAKGGAYVRVTSTSQSGALIAAFDLPAAGRYFVLARVRAAGPLSAVSTEDSVNLGLDGGATMAWKLFGVTSGTWRWVRAAPAAEVDGAFPFAAGRHQIAIGARVRGTEIDAIAVANAPYSPAVLDARSR
ncbi:MAG TPA: right-handed parallel beta-helix repeat-containing protein [Opitutaceae bacterium]|nr:right-handed parallel beta-helix repeat-containing protein [Opitutaceae bacterium]